MVTTDYTRDLLCFDACAPSSLPPSWPCYMTPVWLQNLMPYLTCHPNRAFAQYIYTGLVRGFRIGFNRSDMVPSSSHKNHLSAVANPGVITSNLRAELEAGRLVSPLPAAWSTRVHCSSLGLVPKGNTGRWRVIVDLSSPLGHSVNAGID